MSLHKPETPEDSRVFRQIRRAVKRAVLTNPYHFQYEGVYGIEKAQGRVIVGDDMGCISGDAKVSVNRAGRSFTISLRDLYTKFNGDSWDSTIPTLARCLKGSSIGLNRVRSVLYKGEKLCVKVTTEDGKIIEATPDHEFLTPGGYVAIEKLQKGDALLTNGSEEITIPKTSIIQSIEISRTTDVYDIVMEDPHRNFIANKFIVHNCGKTIQALAWTAIHPERRPVLIVCPASLKFNWEDEIQKHLGKGSHIISGRSLSKLPSSEYYIINYDILKDWLDTILKIMKPSIVIYDESHSLKTRTTQRTKAASKLSKRVKSVLCLTGTPVENRPVEIYPLIAMTKPDLFPSFWKFAMRYCGAKKVFGHWDFKGSSNVKELHNILSSENMIRRKKSEVLTELPDKIRTVLPLEIPMKEYKKAEEDLIAWLKDVDPSKVAGAEASQALTKIGYLKRLASKHKLEMIISWVEDFLEESDQKLVLFGVHHSILDVLQEKFKKISVTITGKTPMAERKKAVKSFQGDSSVRIFIGGIKSAGVGLTLTAASTVAMVELGWTPGEHLQAEDRLNRIGQKNTVNCYYLIAKGTIEEDICESIQKKQEVIEQLLDGQEGIKDWDVYRNLVKTLKERTNGKQKN